LEEWRNRPSDHDAITRQMKEQRNRIAAMLAFLDQQVLVGQAEGQTP
jgi:hypothetical protein